jgi:lactate dehydrogenase-like 2-hydroxyacid dehydrogenase
MVWIQLTVQSLERGVVLTNIGDDSSKDATDMALWLTLATLRFAHHFDRALRQNRGDITRVREEFGSEKEQNGIPVKNPDLNKRNWAESGFIDGKAVESPDGKVAGVIGSGSIRKQIAMRL